MSAKKMFIASFIGLAVICAFIPFFRDMFFHANHASDSSANVKPLPPDCSNGQSAHKGLAASSDAILRKLAEYETVCHGGVVSSMMLFSAMPTSIDDATNQATDTATSLKAFAAQGVAPLVVFEPTTDSHTILHDLRAGVYDSALHQFYTTLRTLGITDTQMGTWVLFPEANTPGWYTTQPSDFIANVTKVGTMQKQFFPGSKVSIMLDSHTYPDNDTSWSKGKLASLTPYVATLPKKLVDSFGLQGFPTMSPANVSPVTSQLATREFLPESLAAEAAHAMGTDTIWLNTGTFKAMYTDDVAATVELTTAQRQQILQEVASEAQKLEDQHYKMTVNLFAEDKSQIANERIDWSYWQSGKASESSDTTVFDSFVRQLRQSDVALSLYDSAP